VLFTGVSEHSIDAKGRLAVPAKYRNLWNDERDGKAWYCVPWPGGVLRLYTEAAFESLAAQFEGSLTPDEDQADLEAHYFSTAERLDMDGQGRIMIPRQHIEFTKLGADVVILGARSRLEVRDRATWVAGSAQRFNTLPTLVSRVQQKRVTPRNGSSVQDGGPAGG
jgi:MraZ protein